MCKKNTQKVALYVFKEGVQDTDLLIIDSVKRYLEMSDSDGRTVTVKRSDRGAPSIAEADMPYVSVSHSGGYTVCAVSDGGVGIDLQKTDSLKRENEEEYTDRLLRLAKRFFHPHDAGWIRVSPKHRFYTVWSAKEAYVKYTGSGIDDDFPHFRVIPDEGPSGSAWECDGMFYEALPFEEGFSLCICTPEIAEAEIEYEI